MTTDQFIQKAANALPHEDPDAVAITVEDIMRERGISKRRAYHLLREQQQEKMTEEPVAESQRTRMLAVLYQSNGGIRNSNGLTDALHKAGYEANGHDTVKVLWSLQKTGHVLFRERQSPKMLFAIKLTTLGKIDGKRFAAPRKVIEGIVETLAGGLVVVEATTLRSVVPVPQPPQPEESFDEEPEPQPVVVGLTKPWTPDMEGFPEMRAIRDRARKARKMTEAARLLEEVGEDEMALNLMSKTEFSPLEEEVIEILRRYDEIG